jgi:hypothetical protein
MLKAGCKPPGLISVPPLNNDSLRVVPWIT